MFLIIPAMSQQMPLEYGFFFLRGNSRTCLLLDDFIQTTR